MCTGIFIRKCSTCAERVGNRKRQRAARGLPLSFPTAGGSGLVGVQIDTGTARCQDVVRVYRTLDGVLQIPFGLAVALGHTLLRSEEHTSELQSRPHLVCRLLLEKK